MKDLQPIKFEGVDVNAPMIIAGPCSAETREQVLDTARQLAPDPCMIFSRQRELTQNITATARRMPKRWAMCSM